MVLKDHVKKGICRIGLQYRPRPHLRPDQNFNKHLQEICTRAERDLLSLMIEQQEKTLAQTLRPSTV